MRRNIVAIERDGFSVRVFTLTFDVPSESFDLVSAAKDAARAFCQTGEGRTYFQSVDSVLNDIEVDWNEQLVDSKDVLKDMDEDDGFDGYRL